MTLNNGDDNVITEDMLDALQNVFARFEQDDSAGTALITGHGNVFSKGADLRQLGLMYNSDAARPLVDRIRRSAKPVIAWVNGIAAGAGAEIAIACHARVATLAGVFAFSDVGEGFPPGAGATQSLPRIVGVAAAFPILTDGKPISAAQARELGLVDALYPAGTVDDVIRHVEAAVQAGQFQVRVNEAPLDEGSVEAAIAAHRVVGRVLRDGDTFTAISEALRAGTRTYEEGMACELEQYRAAERSPARKIARDLAIMRRQAAQRVVDADPGPDYVIARGVLIAEALPPGCSLLDNDAIGDLDAARSIFAHRHVADDGIWAVFVALPEDGQAARARISAVLELTRPSDLVLCFGAHSETISHFHAHLHHPRLAFAHSFGGNPKTALQPLMSPVLEAGIVAALSQAAQRFDFYVFHSGKTRAIAAALDADWQTVVAACPVRQGDHAVPAALDFGSLVDALATRPSDDGSATDAMPERRDADSMMRVDRCCALVNIGSRFLDNQTILHPEDFDLLCMQAYGFPREERGPMLWALKRKLEWVVARLTELEARSHGKIVIAALLTRATGGALNRAGR